jgi:hypothetical protein
MSGRELRDLHPHPFPHHILKYNIKQREHQRKTNVQVYTQKVNMSVEEFQHNLYPNLQQQYPANHRY